MWAPELPPAVVLRGRSSLILVWPLFGRWRASFALMPARLLRVDGLLMVTCLLRQGGCAKSVHLVWRGGARIGCASRATPMATAVSRRC